MWETWVQSLGWEDPLEKGMATYSSILAWRIPMDKGAWWAIIHGVAESDTTGQLSIHTSKDQIQYSDTNLVGKVSNLGLLLACFLSGTLVLISKSLLRNRTVG